MELAALISRLRLVDDEMLEDDEVKQMLERLSAEGHVATNFFLDPKETRQMPLPLRCEPKEMLTAIQNNIKAEYWAFLQEAFAERIDVSMTHPLHGNFVLTKGRPAPPSALDELEALCVTAVQRVFATKAVEPQKALQEMHHHLWLLEGHLFFATCKIKDKVVVLTLEKGASFDRVGLDDDGYYDLGYIGSFIKEMAACRSLLQSPGQLSRPLAVAAADALKRVRVPFAPIPDDCSTISEKVPINAGQMQALKGLSFNLEGIQGPPGTGKSTLIYHIISGALPEDTVALATCVQNRAVDAIANKLVKGGDITFFVHGNADRLGPVAASMLLEPQVERDPEILPMTKFIKLTDKCSANIQKFIDRHTPAGMQADSPRHMVYARRRALQKYPHASDEDRRAAFETSNLWRRLWLAHLRQKYRPVFAVKDALRSLQQRVVQLRTRAKVAVKKRILREAKAVLCTIDTVGSLFGQVEDYWVVLSKISTAIIDEAGTCHDDKVPLLLCLPQLDRIITIGDQNQLEPFSHISDHKSGRGQQGLCRQFSQDGFCRFGSRCKFKHVARTAPSVTGVFQRLAKVLATQVPMLKEQYRMHPQLSLLVSKLFYNSLLSTNADIARDRTKTNTKCISWHSTSDKPEDMKVGEKSKQNAGEADALAAWLAKQLSQGAFDDKSVMVITFYKAQMFLLRDKLAERGIEEKVVDGGYDVKATFRSSRDRHRWLHSPDTMDAVKSFRITSVDQAQGSEADIVILSCVRSNDKGELGFVTNPNRLNVAISRARERLEIFGNEQTLCRNPLWKELYATATGVLPMVARARATPRGPPSADRACLDDHDLLSFANSLTGYKLA